MFEKFFVEIAKILTLPSVMRDLKKVEKMIESDPVLKADIESAQFHLKNLEKHLPDFCKRNPQHAACKDINKGKK